MRAVPVRKLDRRITRVWRVSALINLVIWGAICVTPVAIAASRSESTTAHVLTGVMIGLLTAFGIGIVALVGIVPQIRWIQWSFDVLDEEIDIHKGIFWRYRLIIPLIRVQNVETHQGPILRANGLASLTVSTAAGQHEIPGLEVAEADALRDRVAVLARIAQEDV